jgi:putative ABC transport system permease protein
MLMAFAALEPGVTVERARGDLALLAGRLHTAYPDAYPATSKLELSATSLREELTRGSRPLLLTLLATAAFVLIVAAANLANLMLSRQLRRAREVAVRTALGAGRGRLFRQLAAESLCITITGGVFGVLLAVSGMGLLRTFATRVTPRAGEIGVDPVVLTVAFALSMLVGIGAALAPILRAPPSLGDTLREGSTATTAGRRGARGRNLLVAAQVAVAFVLLVGAGLMARSFERMRTIPLGFEPGNAIAVDLDLPSSRYRAPESREQIIKRVEERISGLPGVIGVGTTRALPLESGGPDTEFGIDSKPHVEGRPWPSAYYTAVTPGYFRAMGMSLARGRGLTAADDHPTADRVVVINETAARKYWGDENPVGQYIRPGGNKALVVGIVNDVRQRFLTGAVEPQMFVPWSHAPELSASLVVRTAGDPGTLVPAMHREVWAVDPNLPVEEWTLEWLMSQSIATSKFQTTLLVWFAVVALLLAAMGVYALISYAVAQRTREIGVRMALGAARRDVVSMVLRQGVRLAVGGVAIGLLGAFYLTKFLTRILYEVTPSDPISHVAAAAVLGLVAALATYIPARRAATVDPVVALRDER